MTNFFQTGNFETLALLDGFGAKLPASQQGFGRAGIEPRRAAPHRLGMQLSALQVRGC